MSKIEKLSIRGIRSFDQESSQTIEFYAPLTLIVGHNGAGKTTIIECLKYITTGDMPPGSNGGAFLHDPKIHNDSSTKAQIKLKFRSAGGLKMVCSRSLELTQRGAKATFKTLEGMISTTNPETGEQVSITAKCAQLDSEMSEHLGVSKAVLESVIFCHQEDSFWPLSEPSILKKKFDQLFDATRYTKALEQLKALRKEQASEIKLAKQNVEHLSENRSRAQKIRQNLNRVTSKIQEGKLRMQELDREITLLYREIEDASRDHQEHLTIATRYDTLKQELRSLKMNREDLQNHITIMTESEDDLLEMKDQHSHQVHSADSVLAEKKTERSKKEEELGLIQQALTKIAQTKGKLHFEIEAAESKNKEKESLLETFRSRYSWLFDRRTSIGASQNKDIGSLLLSERNKLEKAYRDLKADFQDQESRIVDSIQHASTSVASKEESILMKRSQKQELTRKLADVNSRITAGTKVSEEHEEVKAQFEVDSREVEKLRKLVSDTAQKAEIDRLKTEKKRLEEQIASVKEELASTNSGSDIRAKLDVFKAEVDRKKGLIERLTRSCINGLKKASVDADSDNIVLVLNQEIQERTDKEESLTGKAQEASVSIQAKKSGLDMLESDLKEKDRKLKRIESELSDKYGLDSIEELARETELSLTDLTSQIGSLEATSEAYKLFLKQAKGNRNCPLCERDLDDDEFVNFIRKLQTEVTKASEVDKLKANQRELIEHRESIMKDLPLLNDMRALKDSVNSLKRERTRSQKDLDQANSLLRDAESELELLRTEMVDFSDMKRKLDEIQRVKKEIDDHLRQISSFESELQVVGSSTSLTDLEQQLEEHVHHEKSLVQKIESKSKELNDRREMLISKETKLNELKIQMVSLKHAAEDSERLEKEKVDLSNASKKIDADVNALQMDIQMETDALEELKSQKESLKTKISQELERSSKQLEVVKQDCSALETVDKELQRLDGDDLDRQLKILEKQSQEYSITMRNCKQRLQSLGDEIGNADVKKAEFDLLERKIQDNLRLRSVEKQIASMAADLELVRQQMDSEESAFYAEKLQELNKKLSILNGERSTLEGSSQQLHEQAKQCKSDLRDDYDQIDNKYRKSMIDFTTLEMAQDDLDKYSKAIDSAVMKFHSIKMDEINRTIKELWVNTYRGHDIDSIEIRSDAETARGNRSYNYRVVMWRSGTSLDMRGRCSAGQKVLASIIIRLALAESFCHHCGILALDEPTTNLDEDNIESLAISLQGIIESRQAQSNFQLLVITHDEKFVQQLAGYADYYHRVSKDEEGHSVIRRKALGGDDYVN